MCVWYSSTSNLRLFEERSLQERLDVAIQCQMLGEGYDFDLIAITLFVTPMLSVGRVSQYHGRALRRPSCYDECRPQLLYAHLFYPTWNVEMNRAIAQYQAGVDEDVTSLFTPDEYVCCCPFVRSLFFLTTSLIDVMP